MIIDLTSLSYATVRKAMTFYITLATQYKPNGMWNEICPGFHDKDPVL